MAGTASGPIIRIGLGEPEPAVELSSDGGVVLLEGAREGRERLRVEGMVRLRLSSPRPAGPGGGPGGRATVYRIMVASSPDEAAVRRLGGWLSQVLSDVPLSLDFNSERSAWRLYAGAFPDRPAAASLSPALAIHGLRTLWITERPAVEDASVSSGATAVEVAVIGGAGAVSVRGPVLLRPLDPRALLVTGGTAYRGAIEALPRQDGIQRVNVLPIETYLRGVVPAEMGPLQYPSREALEAQAVAARTYAFRNLGQFEEEGYDLCDSPRCQVFRGASVEHPLTDRALRETSGEVLFHGDRPVRAYFTASCGGHTEDLAEVFVEESAPYLGGVPCPPEEPEGFVLRAPGPYDVLYGEGRETWNHALDRLVALAVAPPRILDRTVGLARPAPEEVRGWKERAASLGGPCAQAADAALAVPGARSRLEILDALSRRLEEAGCLGPEAHGVVVRVHGQDVRVRTDTGPVHLDLSGGAFPFLDDGDGPRPAALLPIGKGDRIRWEPEERPFLVVKESRSQAAEAGTSPPDWSAERSSAELLDRLRSRIGVRSVREVSPLRRTPSGRVSSMLVVADSGEYLLRGIRVRWGLGLPENPLNVQPSGEAVHDHPLAFQFTGKGWGHGVGLCQRGAYGLARAGLGYRAILAHYYPHTEIRKLW